MDRTILIDSYASSPLQYLNWVRVGMPVVSLVANRDSHPRVVHKWARYWPIPQEPEHRFNRSGKRSLTLFLAPILEVLPICPAIDWLPPVEGIIAGSSPTLGKTIFVKSFRGGFSLILSPPKDPFPQPSSNLRQARSPCSVRIQSFTSPQILLTFRIGLTAVGTVTSGRCHHVQI